MLKKYRLGFDIWGLLLFLIIMIPNFIWFAVPAPNDILRANSATKTIDTVASVCQVWIVISLCVFVNKERSELCITPFITAVIISILLYFASWIGYYVGSVHIVIILGLTVFPCMAFLLFAIDRNNKIAVVPISVFTVCHLIYGFVNFIIV